MSSTADKEFGLWYNGAWIEDEAPVCLSGVKEGEAVQLKLRTVELTVKIGSRASL